MANSLRDQLLGLGFKPAPKPAPGPKRAKPPRGDGRNAPDASAKTGRRDGGRGAGRKAREREDIDLAKAYAIRAQREKEERERAERERQEQARRRREARAKLEAFLQGKVLNDPQAEIARHFPYGGKIKRIYVNQEQLRALNAGELGVVQINGRYCLVTAADLAGAEEILPEAIALKVDPDAPAEDDLYADPKYQVPDDLVW
ncbi:uncharacterized protein YaiL (DUF2058 family) [Luteimonas sp. J16]|jgi:uncharacterized protein YaiL (DUF2058 family)|uniref:DUF2058 family protein n=1 Tax=unclassified Luteimonas TaxID=2629088 RepID=UPI00047CFE5F|nr:MULTISPECIES: DUF2058 family protein [unclassified Luteimonas]TWG86134.1 uncharacterized protein YaiL (DUF2058 family) [Luteimonas sp. J16]